jgi:hypothetical protein
VGQGEEGRAVGEGVDGSGEEGGGKDDLRAALGGLDNAEGSWCQMALKKFIKLDVISFSGI